MHSFLILESKSHVHEMQISSHICLGTCAPGEVRNIDFFVDNTRIVISWEKPDPANLHPAMFIDGYEVQYNYMDEWIVRETIQTSWEVHYSYLLPGTQVWFEVRAKCSCGKIGPLFMLYIPQVVYVCYTYTATIMLTTIPV